ncbi:uncharacterized protein LOC136091779 [Hydra vulgaris]|uniref:Uncharacterized protein LOC136091779 n=1 Tax=Hydra vulgaris TaxID=6087 RepID=A0ABM4DLY8_HYDVU
MREHDREGNFSQWLLKLGGGTIPVKKEDPFKGCIEIPHVCIIRENVSIVDKLFGDAEQNDYSRRVILTPNNVDSLSINEEVLEYPPELLTGVSGGKRVFVPRIQLAPSDSSLPFVLKHRQFPVRLAYSMTIDKSQGQYLTELVYT